MSDENKGVDWSASVAIELKEKIEELKEALTTTHLENFERILLNREVLREWGRRITNLLYNEGLLHTPEAHKSLHDILAKLEGVGSARQTEEHDCYNEWSKNIKVHTLDDIPETEKINFSKCKYFELRKPIDKRELDKYYCGHEDNMESECEYASCPLYTNKLIFKDSGGEKPLLNSSDVGLTHDQGIDHPKDSKPPEPKIEEFRCYSCKYHSTHSGTWCGNVIGLCSEFEKFESRENDALDALLHAVAPIPLPEVNKLIKEAKQEIISEFLYKIRNIPLFWAFDDYLKEVYEAIDKIRDFYQKRLPDATGEGGV